jgi:hypothetical protein
MKLSRVVALTIFASFLNMSHSAMAAEAHSMTGCLAKGSDEGTFTLTNVEGAVSTVAIPQSTVDLGGHVGHKVEITGTTIEGADPKVHAMQVTAMKHLAASCP